MEFKELLHYGQIIKDESQDDLRITYFCYENETYITVMHKGEVIVVEKIKKGGE